MKPVAAFTPKSNNPGTLSYLSEKTTSCDSALCGDLPLFDCDTDTFFWVCECFILPPKYLCSERAVLAPVGKSVEAIGAEMQW